MGGITVALRNVRGPQLYDISLHHQLYCERGGSCGCTARQTAVLDRRYTGEPGSQQLGHLHRSFENRVTSASITIPRGQEVGGLHPVILRLPAVSSALRQGLLTSRYEEPVAQVQDTPITPAPVDALPSGRRRR